MATKAELRQIAERFAHQVLGVQQGPKFEELARRFEKDMETLVIQATSGTPSQTPGSPQAIELPRSIIETLLTQATSGASSEHTATDIRALPPLETRKKDE